MELDLNQLRELLTALDQTNIAELTLKSGDLELTVKKGRAAGAELIVTAPVDPAVISHPVNLSAVPPVADLVANTPVSPTPVNTVNNPPAMPPISVKTVDVVSPVVGTFYRAPAPDEPAFVAVGDRIKVGQTVCIIEAMKVMNEIEAEVSGTVVEILLSNGQPVEYNQPLLRVTPD
ncbi:MAG: acetyl-CoA carboxylase biotin carboxyl carrier protein [Microcoleaceae cyanobacterium]